MEPTDKSRLTRVKNALRKWNKKFLGTSSPYIIEQYRKALTNYNEVKNELKAKYKGHQIDFEL